MNDFVNGMIAGILAYTLAIYLWIRDKKK